MPHFKKKFETEKEKDLLNRINQLETSVDEGKMLLLEDLKRQLYEIRNKRIEGMMVRSRTKWLKDGGGGGGIVDIYVI